MKKLFFSNGYTPRGVDIATLLLRLAFGALMAPHGYSKLMTFAEKKATFMSFMGLGPEISLVLVIFAELFCSVFLVLGCCTRLVLIPLLITSCVIVFKAHGGDVLGDGFQGFSYMVAYLCILLLGPGRFSVDAMILKKNTRR